MAYDYTDDSPTDDFGKLSRINSAALVNSMLSNLWGDFFRHLRASQFLHANNDLDCVWGILGGEKKVADTPIESNYLKIQKKLKECPPLGIIERKNGFFKITDNDLIILDKQKKVLMEKDLFLRRLQNTQGKGTAYLDEDEEGFE